VDYQRLAERVFNPHFRVKAVIRVLKDYLDVFAEIGHLIDGLYLPKVEGADDVRAALGMIRGIQREKGWVVGGHHVHVLTEGPQAVLEAEEILTAAPEVVEVQLGVVDFTAAVRMRNIAQIEQFTYMRSAMTRLVEAANRTGKIAGVGVTVNTNDPALTEADVRLAIAMGFNLKWSIGPVHYNTIDKFWHRNRAKRSNCTEELDICKRVFK